MDIEKLKETAEQAKIEKLPIPEKEICERYMNVFGAAINDVLREMGLVYQTLPNNIRPLKEDMKLAGIAFTVKGSKSLAIKNEMEYRAQMLEDIPEYSISIWDTANDDESAQWGEIMTVASKMRGCLGAVVDGGVRDTDRVLELGFPVFCKYKTSNGMLGRFRIDDYQVPIRINNVHIMPGDVIFGDIDGVIVIPRKIAYEVLLKSEYIKENEKKIKQMILDGLSPKDVVSRGGYF